MKTIYLESMKESDGFPFTRVRTYNRKLACIYLLDSGTKEGFKYCVSLYFGGWLNEEFETEEKAIESVIKYYDLTGNIKLNLKKYELPF